MTKIIKCVKKCSAVLVVLFLMCSCNDSHMSELTTTTTVSSTTTTSQTTTTIPQTTTTPQINTETTTTTAPMKKEFFIGCNGEELYFKDAKKLEVGGKEITPEEAETAVGMVFCHFDWVYATFSKGISLNSYDNDFDEEEYCFIDVPDVEGEYELSKINIGDEFGSLTVKSASSIIVPMKSCYVLSNELAFDGEITLTGYVGVAVTDEDYNKKGDIVFFSEPNELPILSMPSNGEYRPYTSYTDKFQFMSDIPTYFLGSSYTDYSDIDISAIPEDGTFAHVSVKITDIVMSKSETGISGVTGKVVSVEKI